jgi:ABC-2 type transport system permease protein
MKLLEVVRFEIAYQVRRVWTLLFFLVLLGLTFWVATGVFINGARNGGYLFNSPFAILEPTLLGTVMGLLIAAGLAGDAGARDVQTRMHPLFDTTPVSKAAHLGGRFIAAFALNALVLAAVPAGLLLALLSPGLDAQLVGPFRPAAYLAPYLFFALPNAFVAVALQFSLAALSRRAVASYLGSVLLIVAALFSGAFAAGQWGWPVAKLLDPLGLVVMKEMSLAWTPAEKSTRLLELEGSLLFNRLLWVGVAVGVLALTHLRFRSARHTEGAGWGVRARRRGAPSPATGAAAAARGAPIPVPRVRGAFGLATRVRQTLALAWRSFLEIMTGWGGLALAALALFLILVGPLAGTYLGVPLFPTTAWITAFIGGTQDLIGMSVLLLIAFLAGELVWRDRDAGVSEIADAAPVPEWVAFLGRCVALCLVVVALQAGLMAAAMLLQLRLGYYAFEIGLYLRVLFGIQLAGHLLLGLLALVVHVVVHQKYVGHLVVLTACAIMAYAPTLGIAHNLLVYGSDPGWEYSDLRGFGPFLGPWLWFKLYWAAWALLLAVAARLFWVRGQEQGLARRLQLARHRLTRSAAGAAALAVGLILTVGGFVFYNTNVLNEHRTAFGSSELHAEYERRYGRYEGVAQPRLTGTRLRVEIYPQRREVEIHGTYALVNHGAVPIDSVHLLVPRVPGLAAWAVAFDRPSRQVLADEELGHRIHALAEPLQPGDSLRLRFVMRFAPRGFPNSGIDASVAANGTYIPAQEWLPAIGYQRNLELSNPGERSAHGLASRPAIRSLHDPRGPWDVAGSLTRISFEALVGTDTGQLAIAPGSLRRTWTQGGRRYFHYATDAPIRNDYAFYSAAYAVREDRWTPPGGQGQAVAIQIVHHPEHAWNVDRMARSVRTSLAYLTGRYGPYPHGQIRLVEHPGPSSAGLHAAAVNISYEEMFSLFNAGGDPRDIDFPFAVVAHEVAHQWWGHRIIPAPVEGSGLLTESLAWYSAMGVVEEAHGPEHLRRLLDVLREAYLTPNARADVPLLRAGGWLNAYRKGPFAMYALREYVGEARVDTALRNLLQKHGSGAPPLPTSLDLYRELQAVTPDSLRYLLGDLFAKNTFWQLETGAARAEPAGAGTWRVTLEVSARKVVVDTAGAEREVPMNDLVEIGVFAPAGDEGPGKPLYLRMHRIRAGEQRITITVPGEPGQAEVDPRGLLIDVERDDNVREVHAQKRSPATGGG